MPAEVLLVHVDAAMAAQLRPAVKEDVYVEEVDDAEAALVRMERSEHVGAVVLGTGLDDPIRLAQRLGALQHDLPVLLLCAPERCGALRRAIQFSPFLSSAVECQSTEEPRAIREAFDEMIARVHQRRQYQVMLQAVQDQLPRPTREQRSARLYLDTLLDYAPIGIALIDGGGRVQQWNAQAGAIFDTSERVMVSQVVTTLFPEHEQKRLRSLLADPAPSRRPRPETFERMREDGIRQYVDVMAAPVPGERTACIVIFQDSTRRLRAEEEARQLSRQRAVNEAMARQAKELERLNRELEQRNQELQDFAYVASHDLREPLRKISAFAGLLLDEYGDAVDAAGHHYIDRIEHAAGRMSELIRALLSYSRVATHGQSFAEVDLSEVAASVVEDLAVQVKEREGRVEIGELPIVEADPIQMRQLLQNLIANSLKYREEGVAPVVRVRAERGRGEKGTLLEGREVCHLMVEDNGIGFDEKYLDRIFAPFQRLHGRSVYEGTGMGLSIVRRIAERHQGHVTARSTLGEGSTFIVTLPLRQPREDE